MGSVGSGEVGNVLVKRTSPFVYPTAESRLLATVS